MPSATPFPDHARRTEAPPFFPSYITISGAPEPPLWWLVESSFIKLAPIARPRRKRPPRARRVDHKLAGGFEQAADLARQCARAARGRDPGALDRLLDLFKDTVCDTVAACNEALQ